VIAARRAPGRTAAPTTRAPPICAKWRAPKGRLFALTRDQLIECAALVRGMRRPALLETTTAIQRVAPITSAVRSSASRPV